MNPFLTFRRFASLMLLAVLALLLVRGQSLQAAPTTTSAVVTIPCTAAPATGWLLAEDDGWSIKKLFRGVDGRARVIQICMVIMCLALLILMKK